MDNRTGFRRGPAYLAEEARRALGVAIEARALADLPPPLVHTAFGAAVCAIAVLLRPDRLGLQHSAIAETALALATGVVLAGYDRLVYPPARRPPVASAALPIAAVGAFATVLAGVSELGVRVGAGVMAALVVGGLPQLIGRATAGRENVGQRFARDVAGAIVLAPALLAAASPVLPPPARFGLVAAIGTLVSFDSLRSERLPSLLAAALAIAVGTSVAGASYLLGPSAVSSGARAAALLVLWYGLRGLATAFAAVDLRRALFVAVEYAVFVVVAAGAMRWLLPAT